MRTDTDQEIARIKAKGLITEDEYVTLISRDPKERQKWIGAFRHIVCGEDPTSQEMQAMLAEGASSSKPKPADYPKTTEEIMAEINRLRGSDFWKQLLRDENKQSGLDISCDPPPPAPMSSTYPRPSMHVASGIEGKQRG